jgi:CO/xanthine dehydrogenase Mo-binding subunit
VTSNAASFACGPYQVDNALIESLCVYTNNPPCGAMRGFGAGAGLLRARGADGQARDRSSTSIPIELRLLNALQPG